MHEQATVITNPLSKERTRELLREDERKILTYRGLERTIRDGNGSFPEFYGLSAVMKVFFELNKTKIRGELFRLNLTDEDENISTTRLCLEIAFLRQSIRDSHPDFTKDEVDAETLRQMLVKYSPEWLDRINCQQALKSVQPDRVLNVGDPGRKVNDQYDEQQVTTIDYEDGFLAGPGGTKVVSFVTSDLERWLGYDERANSFHTASVELQDYFCEKPGENLETDWYRDNRQLPDGFSPLKKNRQKIREQVESVSLEELMGAEYASKYPSAATPDPPEYREREVEVGYVNDIHEVAEVYQKIRANEVPIQAVGLIYLQAMAERLTEELKTNPTKENMALAESAWDMVHQKLTHHPNWGIPPEKRYDTSEGYHPLDTLMGKLAQSSASARDSIQVLSVYQNEIFPEMIHKHLEILADIHVAAITHGDGYDQQALRIYRASWNEFLESKGINPQTYDYSHEASQFIDLLIQFFLVNGLREIRDLATDFFEDIKKEEDQKIKQHFPQPVAEKEASYKEMMFPNTQSLPAHSFERVIMSWSWSAHMLSETPSEELITIVWPELDRLLTVGGMANIFPIGHHGVDPDWVAQTMEQFMQRTNTKWEFSLERECAAPPSVNEDRDYRLLQIKKLA